MRSVWVAGILSPILVGIALYIISYLFGVDKDIARYFSKETESAPILKMEWPTTKPEQAQKKFSDRLSRDSKIDPSSE